MPVFPPKADTIATSEMASPFSCSRIISAIAAERLHPTLRAPKRPHGTDYGLSLLNMDTATFQVPSAWRFKILRNLPCSVGLCL
jgi:hypothetical protein